MATPQDRGWFLSGVRETGEVVESRPGPAELWVGRWVQPRQAELIDGRVVKVDASRGWTSRTTCSCSSPRSAPDGCSWHGTTGGE